MALEPVKFTFIAGGVADVKKALRSISTALKDIDKQYDNLKKKEKSALASFKSDLTNKSNEIKKHLQQEVRAYQKATNDKLRIEKRFNETVKRTRSSSSSPLSPNVGSGFKGMPGGGGFSLGSLAGGAAAGAGVGIALGAVALTAKAISMAFDQLKSVAMDLAGALVTLGGGFTVADSFVKAVQGKRSAVNIETSAGSPEERVAAGDVLKFTESQIAKGSEFRQSDWLKGIKAYQTLTGNAKEFIDGLGSFAGEMATVTGASLDEMATFIAQLKLQFKDMTPDQLKATTMKLWQSGKQGAIELSDTKAIGEVTSLAHQIQGADKVRNIAAVVGAMQITRPVAGSSAETSTATQRFIANTQANRATIEARTGIKIGDKEGKINMVESLLAAGRFVEKDNVGARKEYTEFGFKTATAVSNITRGKSDEEARKLIAAFTEVEASTTEFADAIKKNKETADYSLKSMFSKLELSVGKSLASVLDKNLPKIEEFMNHLINNSSNLGAYFQSLIGLLGAFGSSVSILMSAFGEFAKYLMSALHTARAINDEDLNSFARNLGDIAVESEKMKRSFKELSNPKKTKIVGSVAEGVRNALYGDNEENNSNKPTKENIPDVTKTSWFSAAFTGGLGKIGDKVDNIDAYIQSRKDKEASEDAANKIMEKAALTNEKASGEFAKAVTELVTKVNGMPSTTNTNTTNSTSNHPKRPGMFSFNF